MKETLTEIVDEMRKVADEHTSKSGIVDESLCNIPIDDYADRIEERLKVLKEKFSAFASQYEYETIENGDTTKQGEENLKNDVAWQELKKEFKKQFVK